MSLDSSSRAFAELRKEANDLFNRLHSIAEDGLFVKQVHEAYPNTPLLPNMRCGEWYTDPDIVAKDIDPVYFKSTDGHYGNWSFNLRRPNIHLLTFLVKQGSLILVDSTRAGKRLPDALSKTLPIWCAVVNRAVSLKHRKRDGWDECLYTSPASVSSQEHSQIEKRLDSWAEVLSTSSYDLPNLPAPLRPLWITPSTSTLPRIENCPFIPILCLSASSSVSARRSGAGFAYIQGSGDDHESWGEGLTASLFWTHYGRILHTPREELADLVQSLVSARVHPLASSVAITISKLGDGRVLLYNSSSAFDSPEKGRVATVVIHTKGQTTIEPQPARQHVIEFIIPAGKKGQMHFMQIVLPQALSFIQAHLYTSDATDPWRICICTSDLRDTGVGLALAAAQLFFDEQGHLRESPDGASASKAEIRTRLEWIIAACPNANPSRTTLKRVNEYLISGTGWRSKRGQL